MQKRDAVVVVQDMEKRRWSTVSIVGCCMYLREALEAHERSAKMHYLLSKRDRKCSV